MKHAQELQAEVVICQRKFSLSFWQTMTVINRPLNSVIHDEEDDPKDLGGGNDIKVAGEVIQYLASLHF